MQLSLSPNGCEHCNTVLNVKQCAASKQDGQRCQNRVCSKCSWGNVCHSCFKSRPGYAA